jgi:hypothetical protein
VRFRPFLGALVERRVRIVDPLVPFGSPQRQKPWPKGLIAENAANQYVVISWIGVGNRRHHSHECTATSEFGREDPRSAHSDCVLVKLPVIAKYQARTGFADYSELECEGV